MLYYVLLINVNHKEIYSLIFNHSRFPALMTNLKNIVAFKFVIKYPAATAVELSKAI